MGRQILSEVLTTVLPTILIVLVCMYCYWILSIRPTKALTRLNLLIYTSFLHSKWNLYQKYNFCPKNDGEKWHRKNIFEIPACAHRVIFITEFVLLTINPPFYEVNSFNRKWWAHGGISKTFFNQMIDPSIPQSWFTLHPVLW